jgi:ribosomal protein L37AE/L43A
MAIVKVTYTRSRGAIKANLRYNMHRPNKANERMSRVLFGHNGELSKDEAYQLIDAQKGITYFRVILNFDPKREDTKRDLDLQSITRRAILTLEERLQRTVNFIGVEHNADHTELRHVHAIALVKLKYKEKLTVSDWRAVRQAATESALFQRRARDLVQNYQLNKNFQHSTTRLSSSYRPIGMSGGRARRTREPHMRLRMPRRICSSCGRGLSMKRVQDGKYKCFKCGLKQEQSAGLSL